MKPFLQAGLVAVLVLFLTVVPAGAAPIVTVTGYVPGVSGVAPAYGVSGVPNYIGGTAQDKQWNIDTFWNDGVYPDKNHNIASFTNIVLSNFTAYGSGKVEAEDIYNGLVPNAAITGNAKLTGILTGFTEYNSEIEADVTFPGGQGVSMYGQDGGSILTLNNVKHNAALQFFSSDKNDGFVEVYVNDGFVTRFDTWCQGFWYLEIAGLNPDAGDVVEFRSSADPGMHLNSLNLKSTSENGLELLPGEDGYPEPNDFSIDFVAYTLYSSEVPEPGTLMLLLSGSALLGWFRRRKN